MYRSPPTSTLYIPLFGCGHIQYSLHTNTVPRDGIFPALQRIVSTNTIPRDSIGQYYPLGQGCTRKYQSLSGRRECPVQCASVYFVPKSLYNASAAGHRLCYTLYRMSILQLISEGGRSARGKSASVSSEACPTMSSSFYTG